MSRTIKDRRKERGKQMSYEYKNSWKMRIEYHEIMNDPRKNVNVRAMVWNLSTTAKDEYTGGQYPEYLSRMEERLEQHKDIYWLDFVVISAIHKLVVEKKTTEWLDRYIHENIYPDILRYKQPCGNEHKSEIGEMLCLIGCRFPESHQGKEGNTGKEIQNLESKKNALQQEIERMQNEKSSLEASIRALETKQSNLDENVNEIISRELEEKRRELVDEIAQERIQRMIRLESDLQEEFEKKKQEYLESIQKEIAYEERRKDLQEIITSSEQLYKICEEKKNSLISEMAEIRQEFKEYKESMQKKVRQISEELENGYISASNKLIQKERELQQDKMEKILDIFRELQRLLYYNRDEKSLGFAPEKLQRYMNRFVRILNELGYESEMPMIGEPFDPYKHEEEPGEGEEMDVDSEEAVVKETVTCAFKKKDTDEEYYIKKASVVLGKKLC